MNNTPTPRTDEQRKIIDSIRPDGCHRVEYLLGFASILETELAAVTEQLRAEQEELTKSCMRERLADEDRKHVENQRDDAFFQLAEAQEKLAAATEQRDRLAEECAKIRDVAERAIDYLDQSYRDGFSDEVSELRYELAAVKGGNHES